MSYEYLITYEGGGQEIQPAPPELRFRPQVDLFAEAMRQADDTIQSIEVKEKP